MTRKSNITKLNQSRAKQKKRLVINAITGLMKNEYIKQSGKWNVSKLAKELNISRNTVMKYLEA